MAIESTGVNGPFRTPQICITDNVTRSDTSRKVVARIPKNSRITDVRVENLGVASDAGTTAVIDGFVNTSSSGVQSIFATFNAKQGQASYNLTFIPRNSAMDESDTAIELQYAETGTASTTGGPWRLFIEFYRM